MMNSPAEIAAQIAEHLANHNAHGYSQPHRHGTGWQEVLDVDGKKIYLHDDYDCSSLAIECYAAQGINTGEASYTMDMWKLCETGNFRSVAIDKRQRGDILNSTVNRHAAVYLGDGMLAEAIASETGGVDGQAGDQTGGEVRIVPYYDDRWTACYRCTVQYLAGWQKIAGEWYYYEDNTPIKNQWKDATGGQYDGNRYYFGSDGRMVSGWLKIAGEWFYFEERNAGNRWGALLRSSVILSTSNPGAFWVLGADGRVLKNKALHTDGQGLLRV